MKVSARARAYAIDQPQDTCIPPALFIQELENAPTSKAMFLIEYAMEGRCPVLVITYNKILDDFSIAAEGPKTH